MTELPKRTPTTYRHYSKYYSDRTRERVAEVGAAGIKAFGSTFEAR